MPKPDPATTARKVTPIRGGPGPDEPVVVPRRWLILLVGLVVLPWIVVGIYLWTRSAEASPSPDPQPMPAAAAPNGLPPDGPWGALATVPVVVSPPVEYVSVDLGTRPPLEWYFPEADLNLVAAFLASTGLSADDVASLRSRARQEASIKGIVVSPDPALIRRLTPDVRAKLYTQLARSRLNIRQRDAFRFRAPDAEVWFSGTRISPQTRGLVEPLLYHHAGYWYFADFDVIRSDIADEAEVRRLLKMLVRQSALLVKLTVEEDDDVQALAEYWGRGGRRLDIRPLLESIAGTDMTIDIVHLLPSFPRNHLYRYPRVRTADYLQPLLANCLWSALNFFATGAPDDRYLNVETSLTALRQDYFVVEDNFQLGDVIAFIDKDETLFHVAVYLAAGLAFTKNGTSPLSPWTIMSVTDIAGFYQGRAPTPRLVYHRRKDL